MGCGTGMDLTGGGGGGCRSLPTPVVTGRHDMRHKNTRSQIEPRRVPRGRHHTPSREAFNANHCMMQKNRFSLVFAGASGILFNVTVQRASYSLSLSLSVRLSSSETVMALELEASMEMLPKEDRGLHECEASPRLSTYSAVSSRTFPGPSFSLVLSRLPDILCRRRCAVPPHD